MKKLIDNQPQKIDYWSSLGSVYSNLGYTFLEIKQLNKAKLFWQKSESIWLKLYERVQLQKYHENIMELREILNHLNKYPDLYL